VRAHLTDQRDDSNKPPPIRLSDKIWVALVIVIFIIFFLLILIYDVI
jgi:hypothetical protein